MMTQGGTLCRLDPGLRRDDEIKLLNTGLRRDDDVYVV